MDFEKIVQKINSGKQLGYTVSEQIKDDVRWKSVAIQREGDELFVYSRIALESEMAMDRVVKEALVKFQHLEDALSFITRDEGVPLELLSPCKGQKIFIP